MRNGRARLAAGVIAGSMLLGLSGTGALAQEDLDEITRQAQELGEEFGIDPQRVQEIAEDLDVDVRELEQLSERYGLDPRQIEEISEQHDIDPQQIDELADRLGVDPQEIPEIDQQEVEQAAEELRQQAEQRAQEIQEEPPAEEETEGFFTRVLDGIRNFLNDLF